MIPDDKQYELLARHMDGQDVRLDERLGALAKEIARDEEALSARLDVRVPPAVLERVAQQLNQSLEQEALRARRPARPTARRVLSLCGAMAAAAAVVLAVWAGMSILKTPTLPPGPEREPVAKLPAVVNPVDVATIDSFEPRAELLAREMSSLAAEVMSPPASNGVDAGILAAERAVQDFYYDGPAVVPHAAGIEVTR